MNSQNRGRYETGIVLRIQKEEYTTRIFVWSPKHPLNELHFLDNQNEFHFKLGDFLRFKLTAPVGDVQRDALLTHVPPPPYVSVVRRNEAPILIQVHISIPPVNCDIFDADTAHALDYGLAFFCYNLEFGKIASFSAFEDLGGANGKFYTAIIHRIPEENDWLIEKIGTMFILANHELTEIVDRVQIGRISAQMPWSSHHPPPPIQPIVHQSNSQTPTNEFGIRIAPPSNIADGNLFNLETGPVPTNVPLRTSNHLEGILSLNNPPRGLTEENLLHLDIEPVPVKQSPSSSTHPFPLKQARPPTIDLFAPLEPNKTSMSVMKPKRMEDHVDPNKLVSVVYNTLSKLKTENKLKEALELEKELVSLCNNMQIDLLKYQEAKMN